MSESFEKGLQVFREVYGDEQADGLRAFTESGEGFGVLQAQWSMEWPFGELWTREEELSRKMRSLAVLGMCIGLRSYEEIKYHCKMASPTASPVRNWRRCSIPRSPIAASRSPTR